MELSFHSVKANWTKYKATIRLCLGWAKQKRKRAAAGPRDGQIRDGRLPYTLIFLEYTLKVRCNQKELAQPTLSEVLNWSLMVGDLSAEKHSATWGAVKKEHFTRELVQNTMHTRREGIGQN